ncbi:hypothetical protein [Micromonospora sp. NBS 11-29]|uniref:hypothetical protein n=1 Tax=Micromonospora sp. NBS 11-29 TaxID=1960879 RepID=UPI000B78006D|nr:hypothetical protein [Micromonospora sp. NBS 11-29]
MTELDQRIASVLREQAEGEIDTGRLLRGSRALGRRRQMRRRATAGTALALVGVLGFAGAIRADVGGLAGRMPWTTATLTDAAPVPPKADGVPGALRRPDLVGTDPRVLHLGVDTGRARYLGWAVHVSSRVESVRLSVGGGQPVLVEVSPNARSLTDAGVEGFPTDAVAGPLAFDGAVLRVGGTTGGLITSWQPASGLYARAAVLTGDAAILNRAVGAVRWDEAGRCGAPVRLTTLPADTSLTSCSVDASAFPDGLTVQLTLVRQPSSTMWTKLVYGARMGKNTHRSNREVGGRPAYLYPDGTRLELLGIPAGRLTVDFGWPSPGDGPDRPVNFTEAEAARVLAGAEVADPSRPLTWP